LNLSIVRHRRMVGSAAALRNLERRVNHWRSVAIKSFA